jgi:hypothetical protein
MLWKEDISLPIIVGIAFLFFGIQIFIEPKFISGKYPEICCDFTGFNKPLGILIIMAGLILFWTILRKSLKDKKNKHQRIV